MMGYKGGGKKRRKKDTQTSIDNSRNEDFGASKIEYSTTNHGESRDQNTTTDIMDAE